MTLKIKAMMNLKLVNVFAVSLITFAVIFPSLTVFGWVWEKHVEFVETQQSISTYNQTTDSECSALLLQANSLTNNNFSDLYLNSNSNEINRNLSDNYQTRHLWRWFFLLIPFCIGTAIYCYDRYLVYRANIFQQQVEMLEKVWQQSLEK
ncbi:MAG: hypothetical protein SWZ49_02270 [Cyanobacteriota bacterium]|nr:hypothetical protein [Cyanobacteriota bacterium]